MPVNEFNLDEKKAGKNETDSGAKPTSRKRLNVVFRRQNSSSIKELPKSLKSHAEIASKRLGIKKEQVSKETLPKKPRPLPKGTRPVRPLANRTEDFIPHSELNQGQESSPLKENTSKENLSSKVEKVFKEADFAPKKEADKNIALPTKEESKNLSLSSQDIGLESNSTVDIGQKSNTTVFLHRINPLEKNADNPTNELNPVASTDEKSQFVIENPTERAIENSTVEDLKKAKPMEATVAMSPKENANQEEKNILNEKKTDKDKETDKDKVAVKTFEGSVSVKESLTPEVNVVKSYAGYDTAKIIAEATKKLKKGKVKKKDVAKSDNLHPNGKTDVKRDLRKNEGGKKNFSSQAAEDKQKRSNKEANNPRDRRSISTAQQARNKNYKSQLVSPEDLGGIKASRPDRRLQSPSGFSRGQSPGKRRNDRNQFSLRRNKKEQYEDEISLRNKPKQKKGAFVKPEPKKDEPKEEIKVISIPETLTIKELAEKLRMQPSAIIKKLFLEGKVVTPNTDLSYEEAEEIALEYDVLCEKEVEEDLISKLLADTDDPEESLITRNPVVCVMGHVDHGKTSLLDTIRHSNITSHEAGGITQHIGASVVKVDDRYITFLDTPGHEAFTAMRLRGAEATDIAVLVVAADDGVMPQTIEAINHAKAANVNVIVAINKMDKEGADPERVKKELADNGLIPEEWGGNTPMVEVSAKTGNGIRDLLEIILLEADVMELKANPRRLARGVVIEASLDKGRGSVATVLVQKGTLKVSDYVVIGAAFGRIRAMFDDKRNPIKKAEPSYPAEILGLNGVPEAGESFMACKNEKDAREVAQAFITEKKKHMLEETKKKMNLEDLFNEIKSGNIKELPIIIKADVQGSVEALKQSLSKLSNDEVSVNVIHAAPGNISESDVSLAAAANAIIIGFNVKIDPVAKASAESEKVQIRLSKVIYQVIEDLQAALNGMLAPVYEPQVTGHAIIRQIFKSSGVGNIAGCFVTDGVVERGTKAKVFRQGELLFDGDIASLRRFKDEVREVKLGFECGIVLEDFSGIEVNDNLEIYKMVQAPRT